jgi:hypothetical protein
MVHGAYQIIERITEKPRSALRHKIGLTDASPLTRAGQIIITFILVDIAWVLFRASYISASLEIFKKFYDLPGEIAFGARQIFSGAGISGTVMRAFYLDNAERGGACITSLFLVAVLLLSDFLTRKTAGTTLIMRFHPVVRWAGYVVLLTVIMVRFIASIGSSSEFIYFTF